ncbi:hypothetical protein ACHAWX_000853, partial [Stephanocyclus meneghinianus]
HVGDGETQYCFDNVFGEDINSLLIYNDFVKDIVGSVAKNGLNGTIFTYGQTSSGKAFKMQGNGHNDIGGIRIKQSCESSSESTVKVSYVEIYNEELQDLLTDNKRKTTPLPLNIREDKCGSITVQNLKNVAMRNLDS